MAKTKYYVRLDDSERELLTRIVCEQKESDRTLMRARILLMSDVTQPNNTSIRELAEQLGTTETTIKTVRAEYAISGLETSLYRKQRVISEGKKYKRRITDDAVNQIRELAASTPPSGHSRWSSRLICEEAMKRGIIAHITSSTVCKILNHEAPYN